MDSTGLKSNELGFVYEFHKKMISMNLTLVYEGEFTQDITKAVLSMTEKQMAYSGEQSTVKKKVFNIMVECLQNICKHSENTYYNSSAIFMVGLEEDTYFICTGNPVKNENVELLKMKMQEINNLDKEGLKALYKEIVSKGTISDKGGAGLGLIDIARKAGTKLEYSFEQIDNLMTFFSFMVKIPRSKEL
ncbi:MAG: SiaB family protein kinase [Bacteroidota bacterium]|nr:SiaB family protein kinase [Bacteroidota bacterium]